MNLTMEKKMAESRKNIKWSHATRIWLSLIITTILVGGIAWAICAAIFTFTYSMGLLPADISNNDIRSMVSGTLLLTLLLTQVVAVKLVMSQNFKNFEIKIEEKE
jgi:hypothetical protein